MIISLEYNWMRILSNINKLLLNGKLPKIYVILVIFLSFSSLTLSQISKDSNYEKAIITKYYDQIEM